jgi:DNA-binding transcriptional regulator YiaG
MSKTNPFLAFRTRLGLTQSGAAALFRVDLRTWQNWEAGKTAPGPAMALLELLTPLPRA